MGWQDMLSSAINLAKKDPAGMMQYGLAGLYIKDQMVKQTGRSENERPGALCPQNCRANIGYCEECLREQQTIGDSLTLLQEIEQKIATMKVNPNKISTAKKVKECSMCGAPLEKGNRICIFCGTPYPKDFFLEEIPTNAVEQEYYLLCKCVETYTLFANWEQGRIKKTNDSIANSKPLLAKVTVGVTSLVDSQLQMDAAQIKKGASHYGVGYVEYIAGVMTCTYKTNCQLELEEAQERNRKYHERNMQIEREKNEKLRRINQERSKYGKYI